MQGFTYLTWLDASGSAPDLMICAALTCRQEGGGAANGSSTTEFSRSYVSSLFTHDQMMLSATFYAAPAAAKCGPREQLPYGHALCSGKPIERSQCTLITVSNGSSVDVRRLWPRLLRQQRQRRQRQRLCSIPASNGSLPHVGDSYLVTLEEVQLIAQSR